MEYRLFSEQLEQRLNGMPPASLLRFGVEICKRLYPDYAAFSQKRQWGDPDLLLDAIRACEGAFESTVDRETVHYLRIRIDAVIPDSEDFGDFDGSYALNASVAVAYVLQYILDQSVENIKHAATHYYENIDFKLQESGITGEDELENHPRMEEARRFLLGS